MKQRAELPDHLLTVGETAVVLNESTKTVYRRIRAGDLPVFRDGGIIRVLPDDLARYIAARRSH